MKNKKARRVIDYFGHDEQRRHDLRGRFGDLDGFGRRYVPVEHDGDDGCDHGISDQHDNLYGDGDFEWLHDDGSTGNHGQSASDGVDQRV